MYVELPCRVALGHTSGGALAKHLEPRISNRNSISYTIQHNGVANAGHRPAARRAGQGAQGRVSCRPIALSSRLIANIGLYSSSTMTRTHIHLRLCQPLSSTDRWRRHFYRVMRYTRPSDWAYGAAVGAISPGLMLYWEKVSPSFVGKGGFAPVMRLTGAVGAVGCFMFAYSRSARTYLPQLPIHI
jgi:hypothetical protein